MLADFLATLESGKFKTTGIAFGHRPVQTPAAADPLYLLTLNRLFKVTGPIAGRRSFV